MFLSDELRRLAGKLPPGDDADVCIAAANLIDRYDALSNAIENALAIFEEGSVVEGIVHEQDSATS